MIDYPRTYFGWSASSPADYADPRSGLVVHYNGAPTGLGDHSDCVSYWKSTRDDHVNNRAWADIGYSFGVSVEGHVFEGRGLYRYQAAQGTTAGNASYYSVSLMIGDGERPTPAQIDGVRRLRQWLMDEHGVSGTVLGHRDFSSTSCPGSVLYALVEDGTFTQPPGAPTPITPEGDEEMLGLSEGDSGSAVYALQTTLGHAGFGDTVGTIDGDYGPKTAAAVLECRQWVGSSATSGAHINGYAAAQIRRAVARREALDAVANLSTGTGLPATVRVSGELEVTS
ncbi:peptidoglycan recognition protein family protein [Nocardiopsis lucentensis]|uniref:peptidoglycan recognition protein family protein n=1 Tax=Nocardiopsis lucentensis TaxID=53441 RepID=UPI00034CFCD3|nr:N-acetylmuramoyl-L-alanine amidase [Nocardiopsis lucentensis]